MSRSRLVLAISALKARKLMLSGCCGYLANVVDKSRKEKSEPKDVSVVREYISVFLKDLPGSPPGREVEFLIDLIPETTPVSKAPCRLALAEPKELNAQLEELIKKGFHPTQSLALESFGSIYPKEIWHVETMHQLQGIKQADD